ncbi:MAG: AAA family ATPase [Pseudoxanthomonas sp.]|nr:AAA family ATPase [Pseudoxanthomonas sp.]
MDLIKLKVEGFKKIHEIELDLADVNILVGANGSGKSSVLQSVHLGCCLIRQADRVDPARTNTVGIEELDYLPTDDYKTLGHKTNWGNAAGSASSKLSLTFRKADGSEVAAYCEIRSARNAGISVSGTVPTEAVNLLRQKKKFFSAYIPGISGMPNKEERRSRKVILKSCSFGDSNVILRNALLLLKEEDEQNIQKIEGWLSSIVGPASIKVSHDDAQDLHIRCSIVYQGLERPIELAGTGFLQLIQIFCYVLLFSPGVLLIDEPDIHLHPNVQEKLAGVLAEIAKDRKMKVLLSTHSPFIVRGAPVDAKVYWLQEGAKNSEDRSAVELAIGWGAFGKKSILISEDTNLAHLRKIISQWPEVDRNVAFYPGSGFKALPTPKQAKEVHDALGGKYKIIVHRDRDALTDAEAARLIAEYQSEGIHLWLPQEADVEAYFCQPNFVETFLGCTLAEAETFLNGVLANQQTIREQFNSQRAALNQELHKQGGSPTNDDVWNEFATRPLKGAKGKYVLGQLQNSIGQHKFSKALILGSNLNGQVALDLKHKIEQVLAA